MKNLTKTNIPKIDLTGMDQRWAKKKLPGRARQFSELIGY